jgi:hypothetical protein
MDAGDATFTLEQIKDAILSIPEKKIEAALNHGFSAEDGIKMVRVRMWEDVKVSLTESLRQPTCPTCGMPKVELKLEDK